MIPNQNAIRRFTLRVCLITVLCLLTWLAITALAQDVPARPAPTGTGRDAREVSIDFNDVELTVFIKFISELTGRNFIVDPRIKGRVTVISPSRISVDEAYKVFESVLEVHGFTAVEGDKITKILPIQDARTKGIETRHTHSPEAVEDRIITQLVPLHYASAIELQKLIKPLTDKSGVLLAYPPTNTLIITDMASNIQRLMEIVNTIDVAGVGRKIMVVPLKNALAKEMVALLSNTFQAEVRPRKQEALETLTFVSDDRTNTLVIVGSAEEALRVRRLVDMLDHELPTGSDRIHVVFLEYAKAEEMAAVLQNVQHPASGNETTKGTPVIAEDVVITADKASNSLVVNADRNDFQAVQEILRQLDIPRTMVFIESVIIEVDVSKDFSLGTEWQAVGKISIDGKEGAVGGGFSGGESGEQYNGIGDLANFGGVGQLPAGGGIGIFTEQVDIAGVKFSNLSALVQAFKKDRDVHIISTPQILATDNEEAEIFVGKNVPYQTTTSTTDNDTYNSFEYRDVGTTLKITPQITKERLVRLNISQEISALENLNDNRPTTLNRTINTTVLVRDRSTVVIGGLIGDNTSVTEYKVPFLGDLPLIGWLFKSQAHSSERTNLYVFLKPQVVKHPEDAERIYEEKRGTLDQMKDAVISLFPGDEASAAPLPAPFAKPAQEKTLEPGPNDGPKTDSTSASSFAAPHSPPIPGSERPYRFVGPYGFEP